MFKWCIYSTCGCLWSPDMKLFPVSESHLQENFHSFEHLGWGGRDFFNFCIVLFMDDFLTSAVLAEAFHWCHSVGCTQRWHKHREVPWDPGDPSIQACLHGPSRQASLADHQTLFQDVPAGLWWRYKMLFFNQWPAGKIILLPPTYHSALGPQCNQESHNPWSLDHLALLSHLQIKHTEKFRLNVHPTEVRTLIIQNLVPTQNVFWDKKIQY